MKINNLALLLLFPIHFACDRTAGTPQSSSVKDSVQNQNTGKTGDAAITVFKSTDGGQTWQNISEGLPEPVKDDYSVYRNVSFANDSGLYLTDGNGLYHSKPNATAPFWTKEIIPAEHSSITAGKTGIIAYNYSGGILQKTTGTSEWSPIYTNFQQKKIRTVLESAAGPIFIGTDGGLFKSTDNGKTWKGVNTNGFTTKVVESNGVLMVINDQGILRSTDGGENWDLMVNEQRRGFLVESITDGFAVGLDKTRSDPRSLRTSYDGGKTWQSIDGGLPATSAIASIIQVGENFFCSHPNGIYRSSDKGETWQLLLRSIKDKVFNLSVSGNVIYAIPRRRGC